MDLKCAVWVLRFTEAESFSLPTYTYPGYIFYTHDVLGLEKLLQVLPKWKAESAQSSVAGDWSECSGRRWSMGLPDFFFIVCFSIEFPKLWKFLQTIQHTSNPTACIYFKFSRWIQRKETCACVLSSWPPSHRHMKSCSSFEVWSLSRGTILK